MEKARTIPIEPHWKVTGILAVVLSLLFFWPLLGAICFAAIMAFLFFPLYRWLNRHLPSVVAVWTTVVLSVCVVAIPVAITLMVAIAQGITFANQIAETLQLSSSNATIDQTEKVVNQINSIVAPLSNGQVQFDKSTVQSFFTNTMPELIKSLITVIVGFASSLSWVISFGTVYLFVFAAFLANGEKIIEKIRLLSPFADQTTKLYFMRIGGMIRASMLGQLVVAFVLAVLTAFLLILIGLGPYFFFLVIVMTLLNMIPLGSGLLVYPLAIIAILLGNVVGGIWVILIFSFVICSLDNIMRPRLIPKSVQIAPALMTLAVFCGIFYFGLLGVVYGPVIAIVLLTTLETYLEYRRRMLGEPIKEVAI